MSKEGASPRSTEKRGVIPRRTILLGASLVPLASLSSSIFGCSSSTRDARTFGPYVAAIKSDTPPILASDEATIVQVRRSIALPLKDRPQGLPATPGHAGGVWYTPDQLRVQLSYILTNLENEAVQMEVLVDGWNEFRAYTPQMRIVDDELEADRSCVQRPMILPPKSRTEGRVSFDDFERMAIALSGIFNNAPNPFHLLDPTVDLYSSPLAKPYIPKIIDGITGFDLSLRSRRGVKKIAVEATVEIIDLGEILIEEGNEGSSTNNRRRYREFIPVVAAPPE